MEYLYNKEKDTQLEEYTKELASLDTEEERVAFFEKLPIETRKELYLYMQWEAEKAKSERLLLEARKEHLEEQREQLLREREEIIWRNVEEALALAEAYDKARLFNNIGEA